MLQIGEKIIFENIQFQRGNNTRRIKQALENDLRRFKMLASDEEFDITYDYLYNNKSVRDSYFTVNLFPVDFLQFSRYAEPVFTNNIQLELRWHLKLFSKFSKEISLFVKIKENYDELILEEKYELALECIYEIEAQFGISYWVIENKIFLFNKLNQEAKEQIFDKTKNEFMSTIFGFFDMKASDGLSARDYEYLVRREVAKFKRIYPDNREVIDCYSYFIAPFLFAMTDESICHLLKYVCRLPLVDRYLSVLDIIEHYLAQDSYRKENLWLKDYIKYLSDIQDETTITYRFILADQDVRNDLFSINDPIMEMKNSFIKGDLEKIYVQIKRWIQENPARIDAYNLFIEICQLCNCNVQEINVCKNKKELLGYLSNIYSITDEYSDSIDAIYKLCFGSFHASWARDIYNNITKYVQPLNSNEQQIAVKFSNMQHLTLETVSENLPREEALLFLNRISVFEGDEYKTFWIALLEGNYTHASDICKIGQISRLITLCSSNSFGMYERYINGDISLLNKVRGSKLLWKNVQIDEDIEKGIDYFIHLFIVQEQYAIIAPMDQFIDYATNCNYESRKNIRFSILFYIYTTYFDASRKDDLSIACEDFFDLNGIERPSVMPIESCNYNREQMIFFLKNVCTPQIMGPVLLSIRTSKGLEQERISICQYLRSIDPDNESQYDQEIKDTTHKLFLNDGISTLESHKIQVNTDGIKNRLCKDLKSVFNKYIYSRNSKFDFLFDQIKKIEGGENITFFSLDSSQIFNEIVSTIRNEFVLGSEYGLDTYLSLNIRHGTLTGQLRAPLASKNLLAEKKIEGNDYEVSDRWLFKLHLPADRKCARNAIIEFTKETDGIIEYLKKDLIQISTEEKPTKGIFNYAIGEQQIKYLQTYLTENCEFEDFIDAMFNYLWQYTEVNLKRMRSTIRDDIKQKYMDAFGKLQKAYKGLKVDFPEADQWIKEAQNDMDAALEKICNWFRRSADGQYADFELDAAFQVGLQTIKNIHPSMHFEVESFEKDISHKLEGYTWKYYVAIFYILFDNISKYARVDNGTKYIDCVLRVDDCGIYIKMKNSFDCSANIDREQSKIDFAMNLIADTSYLARAKQEGGSGIPKIYKMLAIDLNLKPHIECKFFKNDNKFQVEIKGGINENSNNRR